MMTANTLLPAIISDIDLGKAWLRYLSYVVDHGQEVDEAEGPIIESPAVLMQSHGARDGDTIEKYGDERLIELYIRKMFEPSPLRELGFTYGDRLLENPNQLEWMRERLASKPWTKSASITLLRPGETSTRIPCLVSMTARLRAGALNLDAIFRSQNALRAYANVFGVRAFQTQLASALGVPIGLTQMIALAPHISVEDLAFAREILRGARQEGHLS